MYWCFSHLLALSWPKKCASWFHIISIQRMCRLSLFAWLQMPLTAWIKDHHMIIMVWINKPCLYSCFTYSLPFVFDLETMQFGLNMRFCKSLYLLYLFNCISFFWWTITWLFRWWGFGKYLLYTIDPPVYSFHTFIFPES